MSKFKEYLMITIMVFQNNLLMGAASAATTGFSVDDSCIFNDDDSGTCFFTYNWRC